MLVEESDKQWKMWDGMARNEVRKKGKIRPSFGLTLTPALMV